MTKISFRGACAGNADPGTVLAAMNRQLVPNIKQGYVTAFYAVLDAAAGMLRYASGGHPPILVHHRGEDRIEELEAQATFLGSFDGIRFTSDSIALRPGDRVVLYTDGLYETLVEHGGKPYGMARVLELLRELKDRPIQGVLDGIVDDLVGALGSRAPADDITLVGVDFIG